MATLSHGLDCTTCHRQEIAAESESGAELPNEIEPMTLRRLHRDGLAHSVVLTGE